ncbi:MAG: asparaginase domain-containing protein [bacterium]|jgi:L-asparaginase|nr:asparaginase domain-containing protein [bacterium]
MNTAITVITTGGTIDKVYFDRESTFQIGGPQVGDVLREANVVFTFDIVPLMRKDSLDMNDADRLLICQTAAAIPTKFVVITHGTDTMVKTAQALQSIRDKTIVLTGAMQPAKFRTTDAIFNIAHAVTSVQILPSGIYIAMNGRIFDPDHAQKNREKNRFELN